MNGILAILLAATLAGAVDLRPSLSQTSSLSVTGNSVTGGSCTASSFWGDGSNLTGTPWSRANANLYPTTAGDSAQVSTFTVTGNAFSVGSSTLTVQNGRVGIGLTNPVSKLDVQDDWAMSQNGFKIASSSTGFNAFFGNGSAASNIVGTGSEGQSNTFLGYNAGNAHTTGNSNTFVGSLAGRNAAGASTQNTLIGASAGSSITTGDANTCVGENACGTQTTSDNTTAVGYRSGIAMTGASNSLIGAYSGYALTSGTGNSLLGYNTGAGIKAGSSNVVVGQSAGGINNFTDGSNNTVLGFNAGIDMSGSGNILIGFKAGYSLGGSSNTLVIDNSDTTAPLIWGDFSSNSVMLGSTLTVTGNAFSVGSSSFSVSNGHAFFGSYTKAQINALTPTAVGGMIFCSNCATSGDICVSTAATLSSYRRIGTAAGCGTNE